MKGNTFSAEDLCVAVMQAILLWCWNEEIPVHRPIRDAWFRDFVARWAVARTISRGKLGLAAAVLNRKLRAIRSGREGETVQSVARELRRRRIARGQPISLVSKVAYFLEPERFAPFDRFARKGLNRLRPSGSNRIGPADYRAYLDTFDGLFERLEAEISSECMQPWLREIVGRLGHAPGVLDTSGFHRKVLDNLLMIAGERWPKRAKPIIKRNGLHDHGYAKRH